MTTCDVGMLERSERHLMETERKAFDAGSFWEVNPSRS